MTNACFRRRIRRLCIATIVILMIPPLSEAGPPIDLSGPCGRAVVRDVGGLAKFFFDLNLDGRASHSFVFGPADSQVLVGRWMGGVENVGVRRELPTGTGRAKIFFNTDLDPRSEFAFTFGDLDDQVFVGDFAGDGIDGVGLKRNVDGVAKFFLDASGDGVPNVVTSLHGFDDDFVIGNWDGVGRDNIGVVRQVGTGPRAGLKWVLRFDDESVHRINFGAASTDQPVVADFDGDGADDIAVIRARVGGVSKWLIDLDRNGVPDEQFDFGRVGDKPVVCDWDGDGDDDPGVARFENGALFVYINPLHAPGFGTRLPRYGSAGDTPLVGYWQTGDR